jgi:hypothetical protein
MKKFFKNVAIHLSQSTLGLLLILLPSAFLFTFIFSQPMTVKAMLKDSGLYETISHSMADNLSSISSVKQQGLSVEAINKATRKVVSGPVVQAKVETLIDGVYAWLYGQKKELSLQLDLTKETQEIASTVSMDTIASLQQKPVCTTAQLQQLNLTASTPDDLGLLSSLPCQPPGVDYDTLSKQVSETLRAVESQQNPGDNTVSLTQFFATPSQSTASQPKGVQTVSEAVNTTVPILFRVAMIGFYICAALMLVAIGLLWLLLKDIVSLSGRLAKSLIVSGLFLVVYAMISLWLLNNAGQLLQNGPVSQISTLQASLRPFAGVSITTLFVFAGLYISIGIGFIFLQRHFIHQRIVDDADKSIPVAPVLSNSSVEVTNDTTQPPDNVQSQQTQPTVQDVIRYNKNHD